jgi:hypothetical protein
VPSLVGTDWIPRIDTRLDGLDTLYPPNTSPIVSAYRTDPLANEVVQSRNDQVVKMPLQTLTLTGVSYFVKLHRVCGSLPRDTSGWGFWTTVVRT